MPDYAKMKNADLEALLKERSLPHTGKKAELVARLVEDDKTNATKPDSAATSTPTAISATSAPAAAAAVAAGGTTRVKNPVAVPNQKAGIDPARTDDLSTNGASAKPADSASPSKAQTTEDAAPQPMTTTPATDFTSGLPTTDIDAELEKRKKRAAKFGLPIPGEGGADNKGDAAVSADAAKALERAKRFGTTATGEAGATSTGTGAGNIMSRLDGALPDRSQRRGKRGSDAMLDGDALEDAGLKRHRGRRRVGEKAAGSGNSSAAKAAGATSWMSEADLAKAEARKNRFAAPAAPS